MLWRGGAGHEHTCGAAAGLSYDVETAINVCRQAGFFEQGLYLADKHQQHHAWLRIQLESAKVKDYGAALRYIRRLDFKHARGETLRYGSAAHNVAT